MSSITGKYLVPFFDALMVLEQFGISGITRDQVKLKKSLSMQNEVNIIIGLTGDIQGNIGYSMPSETALQISSIAMGGMLVPELDDLAKSALSEIANMVSATATVNLSAMGKTVDISPPTIIVGHNLVMIISQVQTVSLEVATSAGPLQVNVGLENIR